MNIHNLSPKDVLLEDCLVEFKQGMDFFFLKQLVPLNLNIYYVEQIIQFPFSPPNNHPQPVHFFCDS